MHRLVVQRRAFDCGVAALAMFCHLEYADVFYAAASIIGTDITNGIARSEMQRVARRFGRRLGVVHHRRVDLDDDVGMLIVNWNTGGAHWVVLRRGTLIDPSRAEVWDADEYLKCYDGRAGSLLVEK